jgi:hypothetical protein
MYLGDAPSGRRSAGGSAHIALRGGGAANWRTGFVALFPYSYVAGRVHMMASAVMGSKNGKYNSSIGGQVAPDRLTADMTHNHDKSDLYVAWLLFWSLP